MPDDPNADINFIGQFFTPNFFALWADHLIRVISITVRSSALVAALALTTSPLKTFQLSSGSHPASTTESSSDLIDALKLDQSRG